MPDNHVETALDVMGDMVFSPLFDDLDSEREVVLEEIAMYEDTPQELVHDLIGEAVFGSHALGRPVIGTAEVISTVSRRAMQAYHRALYTPRNIVVAGAGNIDHDRLVDARRAVGRAPRRRSSPARPRARPLLVKAPKPGLRFQRKDTEQYHVCLGAPGVSRSDPRRFAASILDAILGGSASSRLFQEIREKRGMAYAVYSFISQYAETGQVGIYVGTREDNLAEALAIAVEQIADIAGGNLARARARPGEGEPQGPDAALDGVDLDADAPARQVARHRLGDPLARPRDRRDRGRRARARRASSPASCSRRSGSRPPGSGRTRSGSSSALERVTPSLARAA